MFSIVTLFNNWLFTHTSPLDLLRHKAFVFYCLMRIMYAVTSALLVINEPQYFDLVIPAVISTIIINPITIIISKYDFKKTCLVYLIISFAAVSYYLFIIKTNLVSNSVTPFIYMGISVVATLVLSRKAGFIFFALGALMIILSTTPISHTYVDRIDGPHLSTIDVMLMNGIYMAYTFIFISYFVSQLFKYYNFYTQEAEKGTLTNFQLLESNKALQELNGELEEHIVALEHANKRLTQYAWVNNHEVRAPLATLMGLIYLLESNTCSDQDKKQTMLYMTKTCLELDHVVKRLNITLETEQIRQILP